MSQLFNALDARRSRYGLSKETGFTNEAIQELVETAIQATPSAFNAQTQRAVVLFGENSDKFWDLTRDEVRKVAPEAGFENTIAKLNSFKAGQGTILYFIDTAVVEGLQEQFALYAENFPVWAEQENGMFQLVTWTALTESGLGASLQHYNPIVDVAVQDAFGLPTSWKLVAQMPFGLPVDEVSTKELAPVSGKILVF